MLPPLILATLPSVMAWSIALGLVLFQGQAHATEGTCTTGVNSGSPPPTCLVRAWPQHRFRQPVWLGTAPGDEHGVYVAERRGRLHRVGPEGSGERAVVADIRSLVSTRGLEEGLLGVAFHPAFEENGRVFFYYSDASPRRGVLAEFRIENFRLDPESRRIILEIPQPWSNHNGGSLLFGPDSYLYLGLGDGGSGGDPQGNGQNPHTLLGSVLRLDIDRDPPYTIPPDNPFADGQGGRPEVWAYGLRNPWRMAFDPVTGRLWAADVGQNRFEELDIVEAGGNYGWNQMEAHVCFQEPCDREGLVEPVAYYGRDQGISITGGPVYRGSALPALLGAAIYSDWGSGKLWATCAESEVATVLLAETSLHPSALGPDTQGEVIVVSFWEAPGRPGALYRLVPEGPDTPCTKR